MAIVKPEMQTKLVNDKYSSSFVSLYVGDLSPDVTEQDLISRFSFIVPVQSVHLCRHSVTGKSLCYAYVNFDSTVTASTAMACLNHKDLNGKAMRIMWSHSQRDIAYCRLSGIGNLFVKNLDSSIDGSELERIFNPYGIVLSCKVVVAEDGQSKGFGFVQFNTEQSAVAARSALHGFMAKGKKLFVAKFIKKDERAAMSRNQDFTNVYVSNLTENATEDTLHGIFSQYGTVSSVVVMRNGMGISRGFGFVDFCHPENARKAVEYLNGYQLGGKKLFVGRALRKAERMEMLKQKHGDKFIAKFNLFVTNLSGEIDETRLREIFGRYGKVVSAKVMRLEDGKSKGFGFVGFSNLEESKQAKKSLNGFKVDEKPLVVRVAERKEDRLKRMQQHLHGKPRHYMQAPPVPVQAPPAPVQAQLVPTSMPRSYGYLQPLQIGTPYYYMGTQLPPHVLGRQSITTLVRAGQTHAKEKISVQLAYPITKSGAKQKLVFKREGNKNLEAATCSKETTSAEKVNEKASSVPRETFSPSREAEKSGKIGVA